jgi:hypothetical protein
MSQTQRTRKAVFILESLKFRDEARNRFEGELLRQHLYLAGIDAEYFYFRTDVEFNALLERFRKPTFRYLHLSCHGNKTSVGFTLSELDIEELAAQLGDFVDKRRLFLSSCETANERLAENLFMHAPNCYSMIGPAREVSFRSAAIYWASFYHLLLAGDGTGMKRRQVMDIAERLSVLFDVPINCFFPAKSRRGFTKVRFPT